MSDDPLSDFELIRFEHGGKERDVYKKGSGPAVIVMAEIPGITPNVANVGRRIVDMGCSAWLPVLFGEPGKEPTLSYALRSIGPACVAKEFAAFAKGKTAPVTDWLRALAGHAHEESGGPGVGAIGMCFTGGFALGMMLDERMLAPVLSQPSLPLPIGKAAKADIHLSAAHLERVKARVDQGVCVLGMRFSHDSFVPPQRFETLRRELGDGFIDVEIDSGPGNPHGLGRTAHSVVTEEVTDDPNHPANKALQRVLEFFRERLVDV